LRCNSPLTETDGLLFRYYECQKDPSHYFELRGYNGIRPARCPVCNQVEWWRRKDLQGGRETWRCGQCHQPTVPAERFEDTQVR
jgi:hypothetical protein